MTDKPTLSLINGHQPEAPEPNKVVVDLLDSIFDLALAGKVRSVALVMVTAPGVYRIAAAGPDIDGMHAGSIAMTTQLGEVIAKASKQQEQKTVIHK